MSKPPPSAGSSRQARSSWMSGLVVCTSILTCRSCPIAPSATKRPICRQSGAKRNSKLIMAVRSLASAAARSARASATLVAKGLSRSTCLPAAKAARDISRCRWGGVWIATASISARSKSAAASCVANGISKRAASAAARSGRRLQSAATSQPAARKAWTETRVPQPAPSTPTRRGGCVVMGPTRSSAGCGRLDRSCGGCLSRRPSRAATAAGDCGRHGPALTQARGAGGGRGRGAR